MMPETNAYFGKHFYLEGNTLHVPGNVYMVPNGVAQVALSKIAESSYICQLNGTSDLNYFYKERAGTVQMGSYFYEEDRPSGFEEAKEIIIERDLPYVDGANWKDVKADGLVVNSWGIPFVVVGGKTPHEVKAMCQKVLQSAPEPSFILLDDKTCMARDAHGKVNEFSRNNEALNQIAKTYTEIFLIEKEERIHPNKKRGLD